MGNGAWGMGYEGDEKMGRWGDKEVWGVWGERFLPHPPTPPTPPACPIPNAQYLKFKIVLRLRFHQGFS